MPRLTTAQACEIVSCQNNGISELEALTLIGTILCSINSNSTPPEGGHASAELQEDGNSTLVEINNNIGAVEDDPSTSPSSDASLIAINKLIADLLNKNLQFAQGQIGSTYITGTSATTGLFTGYHALTNTVISTMTSTDIVGTLTSVSVSAGDTIYGRFTSITLTSGTGLAYNRV